MVLQVNGVDLHYEAVGEGEPLLWLHGFMGAGPDWKYIFDAGPPAGYRLIAPDLRGHGASTNPSGEFSFRQAARDVWAVLDHLQIERVKAIGLSGGGIALLHLATTAPARVSSMVLVSSPPYLSRSNACNSAPVFSGNDEPARHGADAPAPQARRASNRTTLRICASNGRHRRRCEFHDTVPGYDHGGDTHRVWRSRSAVPGVNCVRTACRDSAFLSLGGAKRWTWPRVWRVRAGIFQDCAVLPARRLAAAIKAQDLPGLIGVLNHESLGPPIRHNLRGIEIPLRIGGHMMNDIEIARLGPADAKGTNLGQRFSIENDHSHRP